MLIGIDEAGRGALAGPVVAGAVVLGVFGEDTPFDDSKTLSPARRAELAGVVREMALHAATGSASAAEVDRLGVLRATHLAAYRALEALNVPLAGTGLVTDYLFLEHDGPVKAVPRADSLSHQVAAASIIAKVERDRWMTGCPDPGYGFCRHKGYGTREHLQALQQLGPGELHRLRFAPVAAAAL